MLVQLVGCVGEHKEEEKVGLAWFKAKDNACSSYASTHHAFVSWLTLTVWFQLVICALMLLVGLFSGHLFDTFFDVVFNAIWCLIWGYTGWWSFAYGNKCWMVVFSVFCGLYALNLVRNIGSAFGLMDESILYLIVAICTIALTAAAVHTALFAVVSIMSTASAPGHLSFRGHVKPSAAEQSKGDVEEAPAPATMAP